MQSEFLYLHAKLYDYLNFEEGERERWHMRVEHLIETAYSKHYSLCLSIFVNEMVDKQRANNGFGCHTSVSIFT